jgi:hypothetical protein
VYPRLSSRSFIEAAGSAHWPGRSRRIHGYQAVVSLRQRVALVGPVGPGGYPRLSSRGFIEACRCVSLRRAGAVNGEQRRGRIHGHRAVASLRLPHRGPIPRPQARIHGHQAVVSLRCADRRGPGQARIKLRHNHRYPRLPSRGFIEAARSGDCSRSPAEVSMAMKPWLHRGVNIEVFDVFRALISTAIKP